MKENRKRILDSQECGIGRTFIVFVEVRNLFSKTEYFYDKPSKCAPLALDRTIFYKQSERVLLVLYRTQFQPEPFLRGRSFTRSLNP